MDERSNHFRMLQVNLIDIQDDLVMEVEIVDETDEEIEIQDNILTDNETSNDANPFQNNALEEANQAPLPDSRSSSPTISNLSDTEIEAQQNASENENPTTKKRKLDDTIIDEEGTLCPICLDNWTNTGEHRICALKCGHLFGHKCIIRWITSNKLCPTCKVKGSRKDIRFIYANKLIAMDITELNIVKKQLVITIEEKNRIQIDLTKAICKEHLLNQEIKEMKSKLTKMPALSQSSQQSVSRQLHKEISLRLVESFQVCAEGTCRVMDVHYGSKKFAVTLKSPSNLFLGYGVRKYCMDNFTPVGYTPLHTKAIRDLKFNKIQSILLSVSMDKLVKITDCNTNSQIAAYAADSMLWSCCWDSDRSNLFYVGEQSGSILKFDLRRMTEPVETFKIANDLSPVVSIVSIPSGPGNCFPNGGIIACKLNSIWAFENTTNDEHKRHMLPMDGPFTAMSYNYSDKQLLVSTRPNNREPNSRHIVCNLEILQNQLLYNTVHTFAGGRMQKQLSRSCFVRNEGNTYVVADQQGTVTLWSCNTGNMFSKLPIRAPVIDLTTFINETGCFVLSLSEKRLDCFKFRTD